MMLYQALSKQLSVSYTHNYYVKWVHILKYFYHAVCCVILSLLSCKLLVREKVVPGK